MFSTFSTFRTFSTFSTFSTFYYPSAFCIVQNVHTIANPTD